MFNSELDLDCLLLADNVSVDIAFCDQRRAYSRRGDLVYGDAKPAGSINNHAGIAEDSQYTLLREYSSLQIRWYVSENRKAR